MPYPGASLCHGELKSAVCTKIVPNARLTCLRAWAFALP
jgi:hypothetical protein